MVAEQFRREAAEHVGGVFELQVFTTHAHHQVGLDAAGWLADRPQDVADTLPVASAIPF